MTSVTTRAVAFAKLWLFSFVVIVCLLAPGLASADGYRPFSRIVVFGDSLSDSGNLFALTGNPGGLHNNWGMNTEEELLTLVPDQAYVSGRLSNGLTWVELLGTALGLGANVKPVFANPADLSRFNFAVAGATIVDLAALDPEDEEAHPLHLSVQVGSYIFSRLPAPADTLYVIAIGGNDVRHAIRRGEPGLLGHALTALEGNIRALAAAPVGARKFLIWNIPDLGATPAFQRSESVFPGISEFATTLIAGPRAGEPPQRNGGYNAQLKALLQSLSTELPGVEFIHFDAFQELSTVQKHPRRYGLTNVEDPCIQVMPFFPIAGTCARPDRYLFWDGIHPTRAGHAIIAFLAGKALVTHALQDH